jgi:hypothetical protein
VPQCLIGIEADMATHHAARELIALGHDVKPPVYARPFRQTRVATREQDGHHVEFYCERSAHVGCSLLGFNLNGSPWLRRQLKNRSLLIFSQTCQEHDLAIRKFQRIVMSGELVFVDLPKDRRLVLDHSVVPRPQFIWQPLNLVSKG